MKKSLVALAALAATASFAQSSVTISGIMDANYQVISNIGDQKSTQVGQSGARTTTFKFNGSEDLGGGQSAVFQFEVQPSIINNNGNSLTATESNATGLPNGNGVAQGKGLAANAQVGLVGKGQSYVGYNNNAFGSVKLGTINTQAFAAYAAVSQLGTGIGTGYDSQGVIPGFTRLESSVAYDSPVINGFSAGFVRGTGNDSQYGTVSSTGSDTVTLRRPTVTDYGVTYANGPFAAKFAMNKSVATNNESSNPGVTTTLKLLGVAYDAGVAKLSYATGSHTNDAASSVLDAKINVMAVSVPFMGSYRAIAQTSYYKVSGGSTSSYNLGEKNKVVGWAVEKDLSKRTFVYVRGEQADFSASVASGFVVNGAALSGSTWGSTSPKRSITAVGVSHAF